MVMCPHYTVAGEGYDCKMGKCKINGVAFDGLNHSFVRKGFKYPSQVEPTEQ